MSEPRYEPDPKTIDAETAAIRKGWASRKPIDCGSAAGRPKDGSVRMGRDKGFKVRRASIGRRDD